MHCLCTNVMLVVFDLGLLCIYFLPLFLFEYSCVLIMKNNNAIMTFAQSLFLNVELGCFTWGTVLV